MLTPFTWDRSHGRRLSSRPGRSDEQIKRSTLRRSRGHVLDSRWPCPPQPVVTLDASPIYQGACCVVGDECMVGGSASLVCLSTEVPVVMVIICTPVERERERVCVCVCVGVGVGRGGGGMVLCCESACHRCKGARTY
jgi:hypothetical protein